MTNEMNKNTEEKKKDFTIPVVKSQNITVQNALGSCSNAEQDDGTGQCNFLS